MWGLWGQGASYVIVLDKLVPLHAVAPLEPASTARVVTNCSPGVRFGSPVRVPLIGYNGRIESPSAPSSVRPWTNSHTSLRGHSPCCNLRSQTDFGSEPQTIARSTRRTFKTSDAERWTERGSCFRLRASIAARRKACLLTLSEAIVARSTRVAVNPIRYGSQWRKQGGKRIGPQSKGETCTLLAWQGSPFLYSTRTLCCGVGCDRAYV